MGGAHYLQNSEKDHHSHRPYLLRFVVANNRLHFHQFDFEYAFIEIQATRFEATERETATSLLGERACLLQRLLSLLMLRLDARNTTLASHKESS